MQEKRTYAALTVVGFLSCLGLAPVQSSLLRQDEIAGMGAAMILAVLILPLLGAFVWAVVLSGTGFKSRPGAPAQASPPVVWLRPSFPRATSAA